MPCWCRTAKVPFCCRRITLTPLAKGGSMCMQGPTLKLAKQGERGWGAICCCRRRELAVTDCAAPSSLCNVSSPAGGTIMGVSVRESLWKRRRWCNAVLKQCDLFDDTENDLWDLWTTGVCWKQHLRIAKNDSFDDPSLNCHHGAPNNTEQLCSLF